MAVAGAMLAYFMQGMSYIVLKKKFPDLHRPYNSPFGIAGAVICMVDRGGDAVLPAHRLGVPGRASSASSIYYAVMMAYFLLIGRHKLILSPEEEFALTKGESEYKTY